MEEKCGEQKQRDGDGEEEARVLAPGFRFHPTDEELVGFYLLRKVQGKSINLDSKFITPLDIYKYHPWDLPRMGRCGGEKERYFMCMRGRKYRNSMRPNRVTVRGCGFWKASGIDKEVDASTSANHSIIGLKKSLVYYQGIAAKGTKTDWMMHEYRFPPTLSNQQAEVWTICRIFKKNASSNRKCTKPNWENTINNKTSFWENTINNKTSFWEYAGETNSGKDSKSKEERENIPEEISIVRSPTVISSSSSGLWAANNDEFFRNEIWDELGSVVGLGLERSF